MNLWFRASLCTLGLTIGNFIALWLGFVPDAEFAVRVSFMQASALFMFSALIRKEHRP